MLIKTTLSYLILFSCTSNMKKTHLVFKCDCNVQRIIISTFLDKNEYIYIIKIMYTIIHSLGRSLKFFRFYGTFTFRRFLDWNLNLHVYCLLKKNCERNVEWKLKIFKLPLYFLQQHFYQYCFDLCTEQNIYIYTHSFFSWC